MPSVLSVLHTVGPRRALRLARHRIKRDLFERSPWYATDDSSDHHAIFIGGCGRSGTSLLREILNRHPDIACGPETTFLCDLVNPARLAVEWGLPCAEIEAQVRHSPNVVRFAETFFGAFAAREGKPRWADKTPRNVTVIPRLLAWFPNAKFIHLIRDGRDVACSLRHHPRQAVRHGRIVPVNSNNPIHQCTRRWLRETSLGIAFHAHPRCTSLRYESLVNDTESTLRHLCGFLDVDFSHDLLTPAAARGPAREGRLLNNERVDAPVHSESIGRWRRDLTPDERRAFARIAGDLLITLCYTHDHSWVDD